MEDLAPACFDSNSESEGVGNLLVSGVPTASSSENPWRGVATDDGASLSASLTLARRRVLVIEESRVEFPSSMILSADFLDLPARRGGGAASVDANDEARLLREVERVGLAEVSIASTKG